MSQFKAPEWARTPSGQQVHLIENTGTHIPVDSKAYYLFGRDPSFGLDFVIAHEDVSRRHAALVHHADGRVYIIDLASRQGVIVNGERIPANKPIQLKRGAKFCIGPKTYTIATEAGSGQQASNFISECLSGPKEVRASHILVKHRDSRRPSSWKEPVVTRTRDEALSMIREFREIIVSGRADFAELAREQSHCSSASRGGDLGRFGPGKMQKQFEQAAFALQVGEISEPVFSDSGVHLILRTE